MSDDLMALLVYGAFWFLLGNLSGRLVLPRLVDMYRGSRVR